MTYITRITITVYETHVRMRTFKVRNLRGLLFGRLTPVRFYGMTHQSARLWECHCVCGKKRIVFESSLIKGHSKSCGCRQKEIVRARLVLQNTTHNMSSTQIYRSWQNMITRCENTRYTYYADYGGRGIKVCKRWHKFENFYADMGDKPTLKHTLDRIDNNGNYCKKNCRWTTRKEQQRNRRTNHIITFRGKAQCLKSWADETGIHASTLLNRLRSGYSIRRALTP